MYVPDQNDHQEETFGLIRAIGFVLVAYGVLGLFVVATLAFTRT